jgi:hypothetical protein
MSNEIKDRFVKLFTPDEASSSLTGKIETNGGNSNFSAGTRPALARCGRISHHVGRGDQTKWSVGDASRPPWIRWCSMALIGPRRTTDRRRAVITVSPEANCREGGRVVGSLCSNPGWADDRPLIWARMRRRVNSDGGRRKSENSAAVESRESERKAARSK